MKFTPDFLDEIRARLPVSTIVGKRVKLTKKGKEFTGLSPFNSEKTPSFTVNDQKGFYHCFSSGKHGDIFRFLVEVDGLSFPEAVEKCANEVGMDMPVQTRQEKEKQKKAASLVEIMEMAVQFFEQSLQSAAGAKARGYLAGREITPKTQMDFRMGYAPNDRYALKNHLSGLGIQLPQMVEAGLVIDGPDIAVAYDRFRDRVMFPIADVRGKVIAFGGRALSKDVPAKYLNSPETPIFHKGHVLYNFAKARKSAYHHQKMVVAEGYMDVIAFDRAGIEHAVAPLGTALTIDQLKLLWRTVPEPILCFDGDGAGIKAAFRALNVALPNLQAGVSLKFAIMPDGQDPDDILRDFGPSALSDILENAKNMDEMLWLEHTQNQDFNTPESKAKLEKDLFEKVGLIPDPIIGKYYKKAMSDRLFQSFPSGGGAPRRQQSQYNRPRNNQRGRGQYGQNSRRFGVAPITSSLKNSALVKDIHHASSPREVILIIALIHYPWLVAEFFDEVAKLNFISSELDSLYKVILEKISEDPDLDTHSLRTHIKTSGLGQTIERLEGSITLRNYGWLMPDTPQQDVIDGWQDSYRQYLGNVLNSDVVAAGIALGDDESDDNLKRLRAIIEQRERILRKDD